MEEIYVLQQSWRIFLTHLVSRKHSQLLKHFFIAISGIFLNLFFEEQSSQRSYFICSFIYFFAKRNSQRKLQPELYSLHRYLYITIAMINLSVVMCEHLNSPDITSSGYSSTDFWSSTHKWIRFRIGIGVYEQNVLPPTLLLQLQSSVIMI